MSAVCKQIHGKRKEDFCLNYFFSALKNPISDICKHIHNSSGEAIMVTKGIIKENLYFIYRRCDPEPINESRKQSEKHQRFFFN